MVNSLVPDPRLSVTEEVVKFVKENKLAQIALKTVSHKSNNSMTQLMALKFYKSLFTLLDRDSELI